MENSPISTFPILRPTEFAESLLIQAILQNRFGIGSFLPSERELAAQIGVTRPTLREALQRLARDGWLEIRQGKPTRVRNYWREGSLGVLSAIASHPAYQPEDFVANLLVVRQALAPAYARLAVERQPDELAAFLSHSAKLDELPEVFANFDWQLHRRLTLLSGNPIFTLIWNGFNELYIPMAIQYFQAALPRQRSRQFYADLQAAAAAHDPLQAEEVIRAAMQTSLEIWLADHPRQGG